MQTDGHNQTVHAIARAIRANLLATSTLLVSAGTKYSPDGTMDYTVPEWLLPSATWGAPGHRKFADVPDMMLIVGWAQGTPPPVDKSSVKLYPFEFTSTRQTGVTQRRRRGPYGPHCGGGQIGVSTCRHPVSFCF